MRGKMMKLKKILLPLVILILTATVLTGCSTYKIFEQTYLSSDYQEKIVIGVFEAQTGEYSKEGQDEIAGIELANSIYGEVIGKEIEIVVIDNQSNINTSQSAIEGLIKLDPIGIIGSAGEVCSLAASDTIKQVQIPAITPSCSNPLITLDNDYYFRVSALESTVGKGLAEYAIEKMKASTVGIIKIKDDDAHRSIIRNFVYQMDTYDNEKHSLSMNISIDSDESDFETLMGSIKRFEPSVLFMPVGLNKADAIFTEIENQGLTDITFLGTKDWSKQEFYDMMKKHPDIKVAFASDTIVTEPKKTNDNASLEADKFLLEYKLKYGQNEVPSENVALGYDAYLLIINAINDAGSTDHEAVREALADTYNLKGVTGTFRFSEDGNPQRPINIATLSDGNPVLDYVANDTAVITEEKIVVETIDIKEDDEEDIEGEE